MIRISVSPDDPVAGVSPDDPVAGVSPDDPGAAVSPDDSIAGVSPSAQPGAHPGRKKPHGPQGLTPSAIQTMIIRSSL
jgi:hypothetical protein